MPETNCEVRHARDSRTDTPSNLDDSLNDLSLSRGAPQSKLNRRIQKKRLHSKRLLEHLPELSKKKALFHEKQIKNYKKNMQFNFIKSPDINCNASSIFRRRKEATVSPRRIGTPSHSLLLNRSVNMSQSSPLLSQQTASDINFDEVPFYCQNCLNLSKALLTSKISPLDFKPNCFKDYLNAQFINESHCINGQDWKTKLIPTREFDAMMHAPDPGQSPRFIPDFLEQISPAKDSASDQSGSPGKPNSQEACSFFLFRDEFCLNLNKKVFGEFLKCIQLQTQVELGLLLLFVDFKSRISLHNLVQKLHGMIKSLLILNVLTCGALSKADKKWSKTSSRLSLAKYQEDLIEHGLYSRQKNVHSDVMASNYFYPFLGPFVPVLIP